MALRINTNIAALTAHTNMIKNDQGLSASLEKLSSGLRINRAADDASGMAIADALKSQSLGLGQAIRNANDGISMVQTADGALDEAIKIVNTIKTKAIQAAQDGQTTESRTAIQSDINKLLGELEIISKTTAFNNQKLLSGNFVNKRFQVGAYAGETVSISIGSAETAKVGHVTTGNLQLTNASGGKVQLSIYSNLQNKEFALQAVNVQFDNTTTNSMGAVADSINKLSDVLGISANAVVETSTASAVSAGSTGSDFAVNGVTIGQVTVVANDGDGALVKAINNKTADHGVVASVGADGKMTLTSVDGRAIKLTGSVSTVLGAEDLSTFGYVQLRQSGSNELIVKDLSSGSAVAFTSNVVISGGVTTVNSSTLAANSVLASASIVKAGSTTGVTLTGTTVSGDITTTKDATLLTGSVISSGSIIESNSVLGGTFTHSGALATTNDSVLKAGSSIANATTFRAGTVVTTDFYASGGTLITAGSVLATDTVVSGAFTLAADMVALNGSSFATGTAFTAGSKIGGDIYQGATTSTTLTADMTLKAGSTLVDSASLSIVAGSGLGGDVYISTSSSVTMTRSMTLEAGSTVATSSALANGSTIGANITIQANETAQSAVTLAAGSSIATGSTLKKGTLLTNDIYVSGGDLIKAGTTLTNDYTTSGTNTIVNAMTIAKDSILTAASILATNDGGVSGTEVVDASTARLSEVSVLTQAGAQIAIAVSDSALKDLDKVRSDLGSVQNQLTSTIANLTATRVNIASAESTIRDVDFAEEAANFSKMQILVQASSFAMAQANASSQTVLALLQG